MIFLGFPEDSLEMLQTGERLSKNIGDEKDVAVFHRYYAGFPGQPLVIW